MQPIRLVAGILTVGVWTLLSRVMGFARDILIAAYLGAGPVAEAFVVAFSLPNMFRRFFAEGAFNMAFVPMFSKKLEGGENPEAFARDAFSGLAAVLILVSLVAIPAMPWLVLAMAGGFAADARFDLTVVYGRWAFIYILFISLTALLSGVLNASGRFAAAAAAPVLLNLILVVALVLADAGLIGPIAGLGSEAGAGFEGLDYGAALIAGVVVAGIAQMAVLWVATARAGFRIVPHRPKFTPELKRLAIIAAPAALAGGVVQVNLLIGRQVASFFDGAIVWLSMADRLYQLPLGVVGIAIGVVLLPDLSRRLRAADTAGGRYAFNRATEISLMLTVPAAVALVVIPVPLVSVLFERGAFTAEDTAATAAALAIYGLGLPAFVLQKVLQPLFFAREDTRRPFYYALASMGVNAVLAIGLAPLIGFLAAAIGTTCAAWAMVVLLWRGSRRMGEAATLDARLTRRTLRIGAAALLMGAVIYGGQLLLADLLFGGRERYLALLALIGLGIVSYFGTGRLIGALSLGEIRAAVRRQR
jgi:putative peptidoglycan lipid II flippase